MPRFTIGQTLIIDKLQRKLDDIEKTWPMIGSYKRIDPYIVPYLQAGDYYELIIVAAATIPPPPAPIRPCSRSMPPAL